LIQYGVYDGVNVSRIAYFHFLVHNGPDIGADLMELRFLRGTHRDRFLHLLGQCVDWSEDSIATREDISDGPQVFDLDDRVISRWGLRNVHIEYVLSGLGMFEHRGTDAAWTEV
jgi:hypothetical protein